MFRYGDTISDSLSKVNVRNLNESNHDDLE